MSNEPPKELTAKDLAPFLDSCEFEAYSVKHENEMILPLGTYQLNEINLKAFIRVKPILRIWAQITDDERGQLYIHRRAKELDTGALYLASIGVDIHGWIEAGLAVKKED